MESRRRSSCRSRSTTFASRSKSRSKRDQLNEEEGCGKEHGKSKSKGGNCEGAGDGCRINRNETKEEANERTNDPRVTDDETFGVSSRTDENCRERDERCCWGKDTPNRCNTFIVTDQPTNRCKTEKGHVVEPTKVNAKVTRSENCFKNYKLDHSTSNFTELKHTTQPSKNRISALTTWPDHLTTLPDHVTTSSDHQITSSDYLTSIHPPSDHQTTSSDYLTNSSDHLTTSSDYLITSSDHLTTSSNHQITSSDYLTTSSDHLTTSDESQMSDARLSNLPVTRINCSNCHSSSKLSGEKKQLHNKNNCVTGNMERIREEVRKESIFDLRYLSPFDICRCGSGFSISGWREASRLRGFSTRVGSFSGWTTLAGQEKRMNFLPKKQEG